MFDFELPEDMSWRSAVIPKKSGGVRHIMIPNDQLKAVQRDVLQYLYSLHSKHKVRVSSFAHGFRPYRSIITAMKEHPLGTKVFLHMDVKDFFDNFPIGPIEASLREAGVQETLAKKILAVCSLNGHFPQGSPTSPWLTNMGMYGADLMIAALAKRANFKYTRYADDIILSLKPDVEPLRIHKIKDDESSPLVKNPYYHVFAGIDSILEDSLGLHLNRKKNHVIWVGSRTKPMLLGMTKRQDGSGYSADRRLRENTRAGIYNLAKKMRAQGGVAEPADFAKWRELRGSVLFMDNVRSMHSDKPIADCRIQEAPFLYRCVTFVHNIKNVA